jgi:ubiquinone/menaquinone biosynthesis C-methylase UbiE
MLREICFFLRYGPAAGRRKRALGAAEHLRLMAAEADAEGFGELRADLLGDLEGKILEIGAGTGANFPYFTRKASVTAIEPDDGFRAEAEKAAKESGKTISVSGGFAEALPFADGSFDAICAALVFCSVESLEDTLGQIKRVLKPGGRLRLLEHVRSEHWFCGPAMDLLDPVWFRINGFGCHWNRRTVEAVRAAGFAVETVKEHKIYSKAAPAPFPLRLIKARRT